MDFHSFKDLMVWQKARSLTSSIYCDTAVFPKEELYGLTSQMRRAAISVPSNIAEGSAKRSTREFMRFLTMAYGSLAELETQCLIAVDLGYMLQKNADKIIDDINECGRMINGLYRKLEVKADAPKALLNSEL